MQIKELENKLHFQTVELIRPTEAFLIKNLNEFDVVGLFCLLNFEYLP